MRAADKICPELLHVINSGRDLAGYGMTPGELHQVLIRQRADITWYAGEFALLGLYDEMASRSVQALTTAVTTANA